MTTQIFDRKIVTFSGLTGTANTDLTPFDFSTYGITTLVRCVIDFDIIALPTVVNATNNYGEYYCGSVIYDYKVTGGVGGAIVLLNVPMQSGVNIHWNAGPGSGNFHVNASGQATSLTWSIVMSAVITDWLERP
jgi:hypothetical protein